MLVDGRYEEVYPNDVFDIAMRFSEKQGQWWEVLKQFHTDVVVLPKSVYTQADLALLPDWKPVYQDFLSVVLLPKGSRMEFVVRPDHKDPVVSGKLSLKFCHEFAEIRSLDLHT